MGKIEVEKKTAKALKKEGILEWPIWEKDVSRFFWSYDKTEECYLIEGEATVEIGNDKTDIAAGDFVRFERGLVCIWEVKTPIKKHYRFVD